MTMAPVHRCSVAGARAVRHVYAQFGLFALMLATISLVGCAAFSSDAGMDAVRDITVAELNQEALKTDTAGKAAAAEARVRRLLSAPCRGRDRASEQQRVTSGLQ
jgi:hypothetical protein